MRGLFVCESQVFHEESQYQHYQSGDLQKVSFVHTILMDLYLKMDCRSMRHRTLGRHYSTTEEIFNFSSEFYRLHLQFLVASSLTSISECSSSSFCPTFDRIVR